MRPNEVPQQAIMPVSAVLRRLNDDAAPDHFTLKWLMSSMPQQSFGMLLFLMALVASAPVISIVGGLLLVALAVQMIFGCVEPKFPNWIANRQLAKRHLKPMLVRAIPVLEWLEAAVHPRWTMPAEVTGRLVGVVVLLLTIRLLISPFPMSNIPPGLIIALISLGYLERDGLLLLIAIFAACILLGIDLSILSQLGRGADWIRSLLGAAT
jgi:hypothetical protein